MFYSEKLGKRSDWTRKKISNDKLMQNGWNYELIREEREEVETFVNISGEKIVTNVPEEEIKGLFLSLIVIEQQYSRIGVYHLL